MEKYKFHTLTDDDLRILNRAFPYNSTAYDVVGNLEELVTDSFIIIQIVKIALYCLTKKGVKAATYSMLTDEIASMCFPDSIEQLKAKTLFLLSMRASDDPVLNYENCFEAYNAWQEHCSDGRN